MARLIILHMVVVLGEYDQPQPRAQETETGTPFIYNFYVRISQSHSTCTYERDEMLKNGLQFVTLRRFHSDRRTLSGRPLLWLGL